MADNMIRVAGRSPEGTAKALQTDSTGVLKATLVGAVGDGNGALKTNVTNAVPLAAGTQRVGTVLLGAANNAEKKEILTNVQGHSVVFGTVYKNVIIKNESLYVPIWYTLDTALPTTDVNHDESSVVFRLEPKQSITIRRQQIMTVRVRAVLGQAKVTVTGTDMDIVQTGDSSQEIHPFRFERGGQIRVDTIYGDYVYGTSGKSIYRQTLDGSGLWELVETFAADTGAVFATTQGTLLVWTFDRKIHRKPLAGTEWTVVLEDVSKFGPSQIRQSHVVAGVHGIIVFAEYHGQSDILPLRVFRSTNDGLTWTATLTLPAPTAPVRHFHSVDYDPYEVGTTWGLHTWYVTSGDEHAGVKWWKSTDNALTFTEIPNVGGHQKYRTLGLMILQDHIVWATDAEINENGIFKALKTELDKPVQKHFFEGAAYSKGKYGSILIVGENPDSLYSATRHAHMYYSEDMGETWKTFLQWKMLDGELRGGFHRIIGPAKNGKLWVGTEVGTLEGHEHSNHACAASFKVYID